MDDLMFTVGEDGTASFYDDTYDITIHCESQEEHDEVVRILQTTPEPLTDKEQRIFLSAMDREERVCNRVDVEMANQPLARVCREIVRKVKKALWT